MKPHQFEIHHVRRACSLPRLAFNHPGPPFDSAEKKLPRSTLPVSPRAVWAAPARNPGPACAPEASGRLTRGTEPQSIFARLREPFLEPVSSGPCNREQRAAHLQTKLQTNCVAGHGTRHHKLGSSHQKCQTRPHAWRLYGTGQHENLRTSKAVVRLSARWFESHPVRANTKRHCQAKIGEPGPLTLGSRTCVVADLDQGALAVGLGYSWLALSVVTIFDAVSRQRLTAAPSLSACALISLPR
jgi:hypothetical protein